MIKTEKNVYLYETEIKPNRYSMFVLFFTLCIVLFSWILNEVGIFHVGITEMRIGTAISVLTLLIPVLIVSTGTVKLSSPKLKYIIIACATVLVMAVTTLLTFHTTIMLMFPVFLAMLYRSESLGKVAVAGSLACTVISPVLSYVLGTWDIPFLQELILIGTNEQVSVVGDSAGVTAEGIQKVLLYLVLPRTIIIGACALMLLYVIRISATHVNNQILLYRVSHLDGLTGLYNQNYYKEILESRKPDVPVGILFFDVNGLKSANDQYGHEYGDILLQRCAKSILNICNDGKTHGFRIGGDEFLVVVEGAGEKELVEKLKQWRQSISEVNRENSLRYGGLKCSMAPGYAFGSFQDLADLANQADDVMYQNKAEYKKSQNPEQE